MAINDPLPPTMNICEWLKRPGVQTLDTDAPTLNSMVDMLLWELGQIGGPEHNLERYSALVKALSIFLASVTAREDDKFVKNAVLSIGVEVYNQMMEFRDAAARDGYATGSRDGW